MQAYLIISSRYNSLFLLLTYMTWDNIASLCHYCRVLLVSHILLTKLDPDTHRTLTLHLSLQDSRHQTHPLYSSTASFLYLFSFLPKAT